MIPGIDPRIDIAFQSVFGSDKSLVTQLVGRTLTVLRAQNGTLPGSHAAGDLIRLDGLWRLGDYDQAPFSGQDGESVPFSVNVRDDGLAELDETLGESPESQRPVGSLHSTTATRAISSHSAVLPAKQAD